MRSNEKRFPLHFKGKTFCSLYDELPSKGFSFAITSDVIKKRGDIKLLLAMKPRRVAGSKRSSLLIQQAMMLETEKTPHGNNNKLIKCAEGEEKRKERKSPRTKVNLTSEKKKRARGIISTRMFSTFITSIERINITYSMKHTHFPSSSSSSFPFSFRFVNA